MNSLSAEEKIASRGTILVVDDELGSRESLRIILKPLYEVHTASGGQEALGFIQDKDIDIVTLDLSMPELSGIEVLKEIKKLRPNTEVIVITGYGTLHNAQEAIRFGAGDLISKPFDVAEIISIVAKSFQRRRCTLEIKSLVESIQSFQTSQP